MFDLKPFAACGAAAVALAAAAGPAHAADANTLSLSGPATAVVGQPLVFQVAGNNPFDPAFPYVSFSYRVGVVSAGVVPSCPADASDGIQLAIATGGDVPVFVQEEVIDWNGDFSQTFGYTAAWPGAWLVCAYTTDLTGYTLATATTTLNVRAASAQPAPPPTGPPPTPAAKPVNTKAPRVARSGRKLVCSPGRWSNQTGGYAYGWSVNGKQRKGAAGRKLRVTRGLRGRRVACSVTATNSAGATTAVSRAVRVS